ncbi:hypothetical protein [Halostreptopolyspora alba]|uniref:YcaO domain-containing protein n=1 Tax=Halostreptopolyspora alba TaxID=2487137 RepID=A0A3N0E8L8_9ACTN|nr:hypothetical protein EFW17_13230 [Nocardiopsaceae bacterium YIM 96095]
MKPKLKPDVFWVADEEGVFVTGGDNSVKLSGAALGQWIDRLAPYLNGTHVLEELVAALPAAKRDVATRLVGVLTEAGFVRDSEEDKPHDLTEHELVTYAPEISFIDYFRDSAEHLFQTYRESRVLAVGTGLSLAALVHTVLRSGVRDLTVLVCDEAPTDIDRLHEHAEEARLRDPRQRLTVETAAGEERERANTLVADAGLVLHTGDRPTPQRCDELEDVCARAGVTLVHGVVTGDEAWVAASVPSDGAVTGWRSGRRRLAAASENALDERTPGNSLAGPTAALLANHVAFTAFRVYTGIRPADDVCGTLVRVDLENFQTGTHRFMPHPLATPARPGDEDTFRERVASLRAAAPVATEEFSRRAIACFEERAGVFTELDEHDHTQLPLNITQVSVSDPFGARGYRPVQVLGAGRDVAASRRAATWEAFAVYASITRDDRLLHSAPTGGGAVWGSGLDDGGVVSVPVADAFPALAREGAPYVRPVGLACGRDWNTTVAEGLLQWACRHTVAERARRPEPPRVWDPGSEDVTDAAGVYRSMLDAGHVPVHLYDVTGSLGVPTLALRDGEADIAHASGLTKADALERVLRRAVLWLQQRTVGEPVYAPPPVPPLTTAADEPAELPDAAERDPVSPLARSMLELGKRPVVIPLDHDPALSHVLPFVVQVALHDI